MFHVLRGREQGVVSNEFLRRAELTRRLFSLELSASCRLERVHRHGATALAVERIDSRYLLSGGADGGIGLYDLTEGTRQAGVLNAETLGTVSAAEGHNAMVTGLSWYPWDTGLFVSSSFDGTVRVWDPNTLKCSGIFRIGGRVFAHALSPIAVTHSFIAVGTADNNVRLCELRSSSAAHTLSGHSGTSVTSVQWSPRHEHVLASGGADGRVLLWDVRKSRGPLASLNQHNVHGLPVDSFERRTQTGGTAHNGIVAGLRFFRNGYFLVSSGTDNVLRLWDAQLCQNMLVNFGNVASSLGRPFVQFDVSSDTDPPLVFFPTNAREDANVAVFDATTGAQVHALRGHMGRADCVTLRPGMPEAVTAGRSGHILVWSPRVAMVAHAPDAWSDEEA